jgi:hypothetical protein
MAAHYEEGRYRVRVAGQALDAGGKPKEGGGATAPSVLLIVRPVGFYDAEGDLISEDFQYDRTIYMQLTDSTIGTADKAGWVLQTLQYLGFDRDSFGALDPDVEGHFSFVGLECDAICKHDTYGGKTREKWSVHRPGNGGQGPAVTRMEKKAVRALDAKFGKVLKAAVKAKPEATAQESPKPEPKPKKGKKHEIVVRGPGVSGEPAVLDPNAQDIPF